MEVHESMMKDVKEVLQDHFGAVDTSQQQLKELLLGLDAKLDALTKAMAHVSVTPDFVEPVASSPRSPTQISIVGTLSSKKSNNGVSTPADVAGPAVPVLPGAQESCRTDREPSSQRIDRDLSYQSERTNGFESMQLGPCDEGKSVVNDTRDRLAVRRGFQEVFRGRRGFKPRASTSRILAIEVEFDFSMTKAAGNAGSSRFQAWSPDSKPRRFLDIIGMILVLYDAVMVPFWLAWDFTWPVGFWTTCIFWTIDLPTQFVTGFRYKDARLERDLPKAALHYIKSWFALDITVVLCDWIAAVGNVSATMRYLRVMRLVRGGRQALRFFLALQKYKLSSQFLEVHLLIDISLLLCFILWVNHVVCCGWYWIGTNADSDTGWTWVREAGVSDVGTPYEYSTSLHWALTQMTPASMEVFPECTVERALNILIIVLGMILGSFFGATLTSSMTQYRLYKERVSNNFMQLQSYLGQQGVEPELSMAVKMHVKNQLARRQRLQWKNVAYLDVVSKSLKETLWHSCCMKCIRRHPFLHSLNLFDSSGMDALCNGAMMTVMYSRGDIVFEVGAEPKDGVMYFIVFGSKFYDPGPLAAEVELKREDPKLHLGEGAFVGEASLWTEWKHLGTLFVESPSEVLTLNSSKLQEALSHRFPDSMSIIVQYCVAFHASLHELGTLRSDLGSGIDNLDIMTALETSTRVGLAEPILERLRNQGRGFGQKGGNSKGMQNLENEIVDGKCNLGFEDSEPVRTVFVVALKLWKPSSDPDDQRFLVKMGDVDLGAGNYKPSCVLPGCKRKGMETSRAALERLLESEMMELSAFTTILQGSTKTVFIKPSPSYGVRTRYLRTTYSALLDHTCEVETAGADWASTGSFDRRRISASAASKDGALSKQLNNLGCTQRVLNWLHNVRRKARHTLKACSRTLRNMSDESDVDRANERATRGQIMEILRLLDEAVIIFPDAGTRTKFTVNAWLTQEEFNDLQQDSASHFIQSWLKSVQEPEASLHNEGSVHSGRPSNVSEVGEPIYRSENDVLPVELDHWATTSASENCEVENDHIPL